MDSKDLSFFIFYYCVFHPRGTTTDEPFPGTYYSTIFILNGIVPRDVTHASSQTTKTEKKGTVVILLPLVE